MKVNNPIVNRCKEIANIGKVKLNEMDYPSTNNFHQYQWDMNLTLEAKGLLETAFKQLHLTDGQLELIERIALSIQELEKTKNVEVTHISEAVQYIKRR